MEARLLLGICDRFKCLPSQAYEEDAGLIRLLQLEALAKPATSEGGGADDVAGF